MGEKISFPDPIRPQRKMRPNEPCWCNSGLKWKKCHRGREYAEAPKYFQTSKKMRAVFERGYCLHPDAPDKCSNGIIRAHTLQKAGALSKIADHGHVYSCKEGVTQLRETNGILVPKKLGVNKASTFFGFCNRHDTELFQHIESGKFPVEKKSAFLLTFRAACLELHTKKAARENILSMSALDAGRDFAQQVDVQSHLKAYLYGFDLGLKDLERWKSELNNMFKVSDFSDMNMALVEFDGIIPIVSTAPIQPEHDFSGNVIQDLEDKELEQLVFTLTTSENNSIAVVSWSGKSDGPASLFAKSFLDLPDAEKATAAVQMCFACAENTFINPSFWESLNNNSRAGVSVLMHSGTTFELTSNDGRVRDGFKDGRLLERKHSPISFDIPVLRSLYLTSHSTEWE